MEETYLADEQFSYRSPNQKLSRSSLEKNYDNN
jgi:hypothetical protein